jgi:hypothetical protein
MGFNGLVPAFDHRIFDHPILYKKNQHTVKVEQQGRKKETFA